MKRSALLSSLLLTACGGDYLAADEFTYDDGEWSLEAQTDEPALRLAENSSFDGPALCGSDHGFSGAPEFWRFNAPHKYLGNASRAFGRRLTWDSQTEEGRQFQANDLFMAGLGITLVLQVTNPPNRPSSWQSFTVWLDLKSDWRVASTGVPATEDEIKATLATLRSLRLPGEWRDGAETTCIDNVYFGTP
jgi:hypothetical protein